MKKIVVIVVALSFIISFIATDVKAQDPRREKIKAEIHRHKDAIEKIKAEIHRHKNAIENLQPEIHRRKDAIEKLEGKLRALDRDVSKEGHANEDYLGKTVKDLILAILTSDHERIFDLSRYEGFSASKGYRIDELLKSYHKVDYYSCVEIEPISLKVDPDLKKARVVVRVHFSIAKTPDPVGIAPSRVETWEFTNKRGDWLIILPKD